MPNKDPTDIQRIEKDPEEYLGSDKGFEEYKINDWLTPDQNTRSYL